MADENKPAAEKAPEVPPVAETEAAAEKPEAPETVSAAPEKAAEPAPVEASTNKEPEAAATKEAPITHEEQPAKNEPSSTLEPAQPSSSTAVATGETTTTTEDKSALDKETGAAKAETDSSTSSVAVEAKDEEKPKEEEKPKTDENPKDASAVGAAAEPAKAKTPLDEFDARVADLIKEVGHDEMWGVKLVSPASSHVPTSIVLQKFLNANDGDLTKAIDQFKGALTFRKDKKPLQLLHKTFSAHKFADLGAVTVYAAKEGAVVPEVFTWNLYGNVKGKMDEVFVPLKEFMEYRIALQELGIQQLKLSSATEPITAENDPYKIIQVHDYKSISFLRQNPNVKAASTEVIKQFALAYPELLKEKFFVNVPAIMGWMYAVIKVFIAEKTAKKFHPMANGSNLAAEFKTNGALDPKLLPKEYGGEGGSGDGKMKDIPGLINELKFE